MDSKKIFKKINKTGLAGSIALFIVFAFLSWVVVEVMYVAFVNYILESKLKSEYEKFDGMAKTYAEADGADKEKVLKTMSEEGKDFLILDKSGKVTYLCGTDTRVIRNNKISYRFVQKKIYLDKEDEILRVSRIGMLSIHTSKIMKYIFTDNNVMFTFETDNLEENSIPVGEVQVTDENLKLAEESYEAELVKLPLWISFPIGEEGEAFVGKAILEINMRDFTIALELVGIVFLLIGIILITMLISAIVHVIRQRRITELFLTDAPTKGHNWMYFIIKGDQLLRRRRSAKIPYAVVNLSFVNFRNYSLCHSLKDGELMLYKIYYALLSEVRTRELLAHATSSNYALLLRASDEESLRKRLGDIIKKLENIDKTHKFSFQAGVSFLNPLVDENGRIRKRKDVSVENEYNKALAARMKLSELDDSGIKYFDEKLIEEERWVDIVESKQEAAVKNEEFTVYYQPKYDPRTNELKGAEALIRWESPEYGFITPGRIIPIFEKNGFITEIDHYMITHVARDQKKWLDMGMNPVPVSVNVSRAHFIESDLAEQIRDMVDKEGTPRDLVEIELTESAFFDDKKALIATIKKLKDYGFAVSMDDFGAGYSSLNSLKDMPLDVLKLDADFFRGDAEGDRGEIVVSEAIKLAKSLNMRTVAEGVEVKEQVDFLAEQGCDMIQGFYYAKPMPEKDYVARLKRQS